jgi:hypothetical protein
MMWQMLEKIGKKSASVAQKSYVWNDPITTLTFSPRSVHHATWNSNRDAVSPFSTFAPKISPLPTDVVHA